MANITPGKSGSSSISSFAAACNCAGVGGAGGGIEVIPPLSTTGVAAFVVEVASVVLACNHAGVSMMLLVFTSLQLLKFDECSTL